jgi:hypothetical protein
MKCTSPRHPWTFLDSERPPNATHLFRAWFGDGTVDDTYCADCAQFYERLARTAGTPYACAPFPPVPFQVPDPMLPENFVADHL